jgi:hypothetical protein
LTDGINCCAQYGTGTLYLYAWQLFIYDIERHASEAWRTRGWKSEENEREEIERVHYCNLHYIDKEGWMLTMNGQRIRRFRGVDKNNAEYGKLTRGSRHEGRANRKGYSGRRLMK